MIHFKKLRWQNFLSTGNQMTEILLDKSKSTLIVGENGAGKSMMLDALHFALFGKPFRNINKPQLTEKGRYFWPPCRSARRGLASALSIPVLQACSCTRKARVRRRRDIGACSEGADALPLLRQDRDDAGR